MRLTRDQVVRFKAADIELNEADEVLATTPAELLGDEDVERYIRAHDRFGDVFNECRDWIASEVKGQDFDPTTRSVAMVEDGGEAPVGRDWSR